MRLGWSSRSNDLDSPEAFEKHAVSLIASLTDLRKAPMVEEEYHGPLLMSSDAERRYDARSGGERGDSHEAQAGHRGAHQRTVCIQLPCARAAGVYGRSR